MSTALCVRGTLLLFASALLACVTGCSTTSLIDSWQSPTLHRSEMNHVLVVAVTANPTYRVLFERSFVKALQEKGIDAKASMDVIGDAMPTREKVSAHLKDGGTRYVIATRYGGAQITKEVVPESVRTYYVGPYYPTYSSYWDYNTITVTRDAYVEQTTTVLLTTSIFDAKSEELVWAGRSKSFEMGSLAYAAEDLAREIVARLK